MREKNFGNDYWITMVYVDSYENNELKGWFHNPYLEEAQHFSSLSDFLIMMESMLDAMCMPQSYASNRTFRPVPASTPGISYGTFSRGRTATFCLSIRFRQNSSWQGSITWLEQNNKQNFRSVLELVVLMDSALRVAEFPSQKKESAVLA